MRMLHKAMADSFVLVVFITILSHFVEVKGSNLSPILDIEERILTSENSRIINFKCTSNVPTMMCGVEFVLDGKTLDNLRSSNKICYHMEKVCDQSICTCSEDCRTFQLNYTDTKNMKTFTFGCSARFEDEMKNTPNFEILKFFNGTTSYVYKKESQNTNTQPPVHDNNIKDDEGNKLDAFCPRNTQTTSWTWIAIVELLMLIGIVMVFVIYKKFWKAGRRKRQDIGEYVPLLEEESRHLMKEKCEGIHHCHTCNVPATCAICIDCETRYCEICCDAHIKYYKTHTVCQMQHVFTNESVIRCKVCKKEKASKVCSTCNKIICAVCIKNHPHDPKLLLPLNPQWKRRYTISTSMDGHELECKTKISIHSDVDNPPTRISGIVVLSDDCIVVADMNNNKLQIYQNQKYEKSFDLNDEPRGMVSMTGKRLAVTFRHLREIAIYEVQNGNIEDIKRVNIGKYKPFAVSYDKGYFAVEVNEGEDGMILITDEDDVLHEITNSNNKWAYFTGNTIRLALDKDDEKVFVAAMSKKSVSCLNFSGDVLWTISMPSPRSMVLISENSCKSLIVASRRCSAVYRISTQDGNDEILMAKDIIESPRYMAIDENNKKLCIEVGVGEELKLLLFNLSADVFKDISKTTSHIRKETS